MICVIFISTALVQFYFLLFWGFLNARLWALNTKKITKFEPKNKRGSESQHKNISSGIKARKRDFEILTVCLEECRLMEDRRSWPWQTSQEWKSFPLQASLSHQTPLTACIHSRASIPQRKQWYRLMSKWLFSFLSVCFSSPTHLHPDLASMSGTS